MKETSPTDKNYAADLRERIQKQAAAAHQAYVNQEPLAKSLGRGAIKLMTEYREILMKEQGATSVGDFMGVPVDGLDHDDAMTVLSSILNMNEGLSDEVAFLQAVIRVASEATGVNLIEAAGSAGVLPPETPEDAITFKL